MKNPSQFFSALIDQYSPTTDTGDFKISENIKVRLAKSFDLKKFALIGSHSRNSGAVGISDLDYMAVLSRDEARWGKWAKSSTTFLNNVRDDLSERFWNSDISKDGQAIVVQFANGQSSVDIVPAIFLGMNQYRRPSYQIADGKGGWLETSPEAHNLYIATADEKSGGKLKNVARIFNVWRYSRANPIPISSFHVELLLASTGICVGVKSYGQCLLELLTALESRACRAIQDPLKISGLIPACRTESQRLLALKTVKSSLLHARKARMALALSKPNLAVDQWDMAFNKILA